MSSPPESPAVPEAAQQETPATPTKPGPEAETLGAPPEAAKTDNDVKEKEEEKKRRKSDKRRSMLANRSSRMRSRSKDSMSNTTPVEEGEDADTMQSVITEIARESGSLSPADKTSKALKDRASPRRSKSKMTMAEALAITAPDSAVEAKVFPKELMDLVNTKIMVETGVDFESRPMLAFFACGLPDPKEYDYDLLLEALVYKLDTFVENDYVLVFFNAAAAHRPSVKWLVKAYRALGYKYRKNLKHLYVVHPSMWVKFLMNMMNTIISSKFAKKLSYVDGLSQLATFVPLKQIPMPDAIEKYNDQYGKAAAPGAPEQANKAGAFFGKPLEEFMSASTGVDEALPDALETLIDYLRKNALTTKGLFRRSPSSVELQEAKKRLNKGETPSYDTYGPHVAAVLLKMFLRELPEPLLPPASYEALDALDGIKDLSPAQVKPYLQHGAFTPHHRLLLRHLLRLLRDVSAASAENLMTTENLAIVFAPNLHRCSDGPARDMQRMGVVTRLMRCLIDATEDQLF